MRKLIKNSQSYTIKYTTESEYELREFDSYCTGISTVLGLKLLMLTHFTYRYLTQISKVRQKKKKKYKTPTIYQVQALDTEETSQTQVLHALMDLII